MYVIREMNTNDGKKYFEEDDEAPKSINRGHHLFKEFVKLMLYRNAANYDSMVLLSAVKGSGKSSTGIMLCREWMKLQGRKFDPAKHIAYTNEDLMRKIDDAEPFSAILADEAINFCLKADWNRPENKELKKKHRGTKAQLKDYVEAINKFGKFDKILIDGRARVDCAKQALKHLKDGGIVFVHDFWKRKRYKKILNWYKEIESTENGMIVLMKK